MDWLASIKQCCALGLKPLLGGADLHSYMMRMLTKTVYSYVGNFKF